ncbi:MAG: glycosyltransferase family 4 protein [Hydrogenovibrio sp.]|uniref:glycosyltransferase family 4 protein n=1 Tax=Hydrogenovibrio sp. TaxID=2065821 RepID=UPI0028707A23|nr:glycosyltransferase family 4 protein [Hydrogenovibrio sp.]MDR9498533.1 glycosyltransferase family 4 protein [Hydrogenovibrio sp.]MDR9499237.1 glycosyltransferase family 4 protein [Hydrogenovibrio sp.]
MAKTIWYISKYFAPPSASSPGSRGWLLMKEFAAKGNHPVVITSDSNNLVDLPSFESKVKSYRQEGVELVWLKTMKYSVAKSSRRILSWFHFEWNLFWLDKKGLPKPDVVIVSSLSLLTILNGIFLKKKYKCKLVFEIRDIWPLTIVEEGGFSPRNPFVIFLGVIERWGYKRSDLILGTMPNLGEHVKQVLGYSKPVGCIPMGVESSMLTTNQRRVSQEYIDQYLNPGYFNVVHAGTVGITNALETFFKAADAFKDNSNIRFVIVGDGALKKTYQGKYGYLPNLVFAPKVDKNQVQSVLSCADVVYFSVFKSKVWDYGQSLNKVVDYMLSGKPILASYSGFPSMINDAGCGYFIPAEDLQALVLKIEELEMMPEIERNLIGTKGREWLFENRSYEKLADDYLTLMFEQQG